ncbi:MAG: hypothetical protein DMG05_13310 [Acidobacteria bacterium]|nr:MAG: hypothetical protein DMG05_13310 [Acidobacteriota bacterium]
MPHKDLKNSPLVEATLEIRWALTEESVPGIKIDPHYKMLLGRFYERVMEVYPVHETLPAATMPEAMVAHQAQHLLRVAPSRGPVLQLGPGILSIHEGEEYSWKEFAWRCAEAISKLVEAYPKSAEFKVEALRLRYLDAVGFDFRRENILDFLKDKFKTTVQLPSALFQDSPIQPQPVGLSWQASFRENTLRGTISVGFATGEKESRPALLWEIIVESREDEVPQIPRDFQSWLQEAHSLSIDWFFKLIAGDLEKSFGGD